MANTITGNTGDNTLSGASGNDTLNGGAGNDLLDGGTGIDSLVGGDGNDTYYIDSSSDKVVETTAGATGGTDLVNSTVTYTLPDNVENLTLTGSTAINGTGNTGNNTITGNTGANLLTGGDGNDSLVGGSGNDTLVGGNGNDTLNGGSGQDFFRFNSPLEGIDTISSYVVADDTIQVSAAGFGGGLTPGSAITTAQFIKGTAATTSAHRFIYNSSNGRLFFDVDGNGATPAVQIATLSSGLAMTNAEIFVVA